MAEDLSVRCGLFFKEVSGDTAEMAVRLVKATAVAGNQYLQNAVSKIPGLAAESYFTLKDIAENLPKHITQGAQYAYEDGSSFWESPEEYLIDYATAATNFSGEMFNAASEMLWDGSLLGFLDAFYKDGELSDIPESLPGYDEPHEEEAGTYFLPAKAQLVQDWDVVADRYVSAGHSSAFVQWAFAYAGAELPDNHIWVDWNVGYFFIPYPFVYRNDHPSFIEGWANPANGYTLQQSNYSGGYCVEAELYTSPGKPFIYYPTRPPSNTPNPFVPFFLVLLPLLLGSFSIGASPWVFGALVINGEPFMINGEGFEVRES